MTPFLVACRAGNLEIVRFILSNEDLDDIIRLKTHKTSISHSNAVHLHAYSGNYELFLLLA